MHKNKHIVGILRKRANLSISELGRISGVSRTTLYAIEEGKPPRPNTAVKVLSAMMRDSRCQPIHDELMNEIERIGADTGLGVAIGDPFYSLERIANDLKQIGAGEPKTKYEQAIRTCAEITEHMYLCLGEKRPQRSYKG